MDPNEALAKIRRLTGDLNILSFEGDAFWLADAIVSLDEWLTNGGFPPDDWTKDDDK